MNTLSTTVDSQNKEHKYVDPVKLSFRQKIEELMSMFFACRLKLFWFYKKGLYDSQFLG